MLPRAEYPDRPPGPLFGFWSLLYIDPWKMLKRQLSGFRALRKKQFIEKLRPGEPCPDFELERTDGSRFRTSDFRGKKHLVVEFGAVT
ncbi:MAG: hypothetical protein ACE5JJ_02600 [Nitrospinota bacterium]